MMRQRSPSILLYLFFHLIEERFFFKVYSLFIASGESKNSQTGGGAQPKGGCQTIIMANFSDKCMNMKKIGPRGRARSWRLRPLVSAKDHRQFSETFFRKFFFNIRLHFELCEEVSFLSSLDLTIVLEMATT